MKRDTETRTILSPQTLLDIQKIEGHPTANSGDKKDIGQTDMSVGWYATPQGEGEEEPSTSAP